MIKEFKEYLKKSKFQIILLVVLLLFAFGIRLLNTGYSIDTEFFIYDYNATYTWMTNLNRWGYTLLNKIFLIGPSVIYASNFLMIINIILFSIGLNFIVYRTLNSKNQEIFKNIQFILPSIFLINPIFAEQLNFTMQNFAFSFGLLLIPVNILLREYATTLKKIPKYILMILSTFLTALSFGVYQSILLLYVLIIAILYFLRCYCKEDNEFKYLINEIIFFIISVLVYFIIAKIVGDGNNYLKFAPSLKAYLSTIYYFTISLLKNETIFYNIGYSIALLSIIGILIYLFRKKKLNIGLVLASIGIILSPWYLILITGVNQMKRTQTNYPLFIAFSILLLLILLGKNKKLKPAYYLILTFACCFIFYQANHIVRLFSSDMIRYKDDYILAQKIQHNIENQAWYDINKNYKLMFLGYKECTNKEFNLKGEVMGYSFFEFDYEHYYGPTQRASVFLTNLGYPYEAVSEKEYKKLKEEYSDMDIYPNKDSIKLVNDNIIIIRLSKEI